MECSVKVGSYASAKSINPWGPIPADMSQYFLSVREPVCFIIQSVDGLTLSSVYTHFNTLKKKTLGKHCGKR